MSRHLPIDPAFRGLLLAVLCAACGPKQGPEAPVPTNDGPPSARVPDPRVQLPGVDLGREDTDGELPLLDYDGFTLAAPADALALVVHRSQMGNESQALVGQTTHLCTQTDCGDHQDVLNDGEPIRRDCGQIGCTEYHLLVRSHGHEMGRIDTTEDLIRALGTIDSPAEARLLAWSKGFDVATMPVEKEGRFAVTAKENISDCPVQIDDVTLAIAADGTIEEVARTENPTSMCVGRLAPIDRGVVQAPTTMGEWLAQAAEMEAEAAIAFRVLADELREHRAPDALVSACLAAAQDEDRHATRMAEQAERFGGHVCWPQAGVHTTRSLAAIAVDNGAEGLGREVWGTLLAYWQARHAPDPALRDLFASIAHDEARHADISRALHDWLAPQLSGTERAAVDQARTQAWADVAHGTCDLPLALRCALGLPETPRSLWESATALHLAA